MKKIRIIVIWSLIAMFFQISGLLFLNNYYWKSQTSFDVQQVDENDDSSDLKVHVNIPNGAKSIMTSYNGKHLSYVLDDNIIIVNTATGGKTKLEIPSGATISYYRWLPDRDRMIVAEKYIKGPKPYIQFTYFDENAGGRTEIVDNHKQLAKIPLTDSKYEVNNISLSTAMSVMFIRLSRSGYKNVIYQMNIMAHLNKYTTNNFLLGSMGALNMEGKFVYEDLTNKKLLISEINKQITLPDVKFPELLGIDNEDNIYVGNNADGKITKLFYGTRDVNTKDWKSIDFPEPVNKDDIFITPKGKVFVNDNLKGQITDMSNNKIIKYKGIFISLYDKGIISEDGTEVINQTFEGNQ